MQTSAFIRRVREHPPAREMDPALQPLEPEPLSGPSPFSRPPSLSSEVDPRLLKLTREELLDVLTGKKRIDGILPPLPAARRRAARPAQNRQARGPFSS
jgi:hypothetical protein